jgi:hypothetical protein
MIADVVKKEIIKLHFQGKSLGNIQIYISQKYDDNRRISRMGISKILKKFELHGSITDRRKTNKGARRINRRRRNKEAVELFLATHERSSVKTISSHINVAPSAVWKILKDLKYKSYKINRHQEIFNVDMERRENFCFHVMEDINNEVVKISNILFTDECSFTLNNEPNIQNTRQWAQENPHLLTQSKTQYPQRVNVWAGIIGQNYVGPFFIDGNLNGEKFLDLLRNSIIPQLITLDIPIEDIIFQMDGCPAHQSHQVKEYLMETFGNKIIGPYNDVYSRWPARSPDLSPNDFFLWGHLKSVIYKGQKIETIDELKEKITEGMTRISPRSYTNVGREFYHRLTYCLSARGDIFEHRI